MASRLSTASSGTTGRAGSANRRSGSGDDTPGSGRVTSGREYVEEKNVVRYTREKLLSMRPRMDPSVSRPEGLKILDDTPLLSPEPLDPVCWDNFDAEDIWNQSRERRPAKSQSSGVPVRRDLDQVERRGSSRVEEDRWQRGVALPPPGEGSRRDNNDQFESDNPDDLWDDPLSPTEAAADFSAFGGSLEDDPKSSVGNVFDLAMMAEATKKFDDEVRGTGETGSVGMMESHDHAVNPKRPLASAGTTIRSGSGNDVNVFEDFDVPEVESSGNDAIRSGTTETQTASSRLMQMIGVSASDDTTVNIDLPQPQPQPQPISSDSHVFGVFGASSAIPSNPWGAPISGSVGGLDLGAKLREVSQVESQNAELELRRKQQEEEKRRAALLAQQQAEQQAKQSVVQTQQAQARHPPEYSQVELILAERISTVLENCWGRADLITILQTLHNDDSRVIPILGSVDALRALIVRHPLRFALTKDPTFGAEMAVLVMNNMQWQQHRAAEELQHQKMLAAKEAEARAKAEAARVSKQVIIPDAPWYYADPQGNIQGPFKGIEMRQWLEAGYFNEDLPISQNRNGGFSALSLLFPDLSVAFKPTAPSEEQKVRTAEMDARAAAEARAKAEAQAREAAEIAARAKAAEEAEAAKIKETSNIPDQSAQLKMLLGLGNGNTNEVVGIESAPRSDANMEQVESTTKNKTTKSKSKKTNPSKSDENSSAPAVVQTPAWGGAGTSKSQSKNKSMSEIQKEEAREAALLAKQKKLSSQTSGSGWAGVAASGGTTAWTGATVRAASGPSSGPTAGNMQQVPTKQQASSSNSHMQGSNSRTSTQKTLEEFGANDKMTPELENWCKQQMRKLNGSDDLTLVAFCMTLNDSVEIKQYLTAYLGSTPQVNNFASEFINRKNGTKQQEQWETTTSGKKGRKKKVTK